MFGRGLASQLGLELRQQLGVSRVAILIGSKVRDAVWAQLSLAGLRDFAVVEVPSGLLTEERAQRVAVELRGVRADAVVAVGGGRVIDAAKVAIARSGRLLPLAAVPTTAGTGSEVTGFATLWDLENGRKLSVEAPHLVPRFALVDPALGLTCPHDVAASAGIDALSQAIESYWSIRSTPGTRARAKAAFSLLIPALGDFANGKFAEDTQNALSLGSLFAGAAIANTYTGACHALSYFLTLEYGLSHGHACGVTLGRLIRYNANVSEADCIDDRGPSYVQRIVDRVSSALGAKSPQAGAGMPDRLLAGLDLTTLDELAFDHDALVREALSYGRITTNPRAITIGDLMAILS